MHICIMHTNYDDMRTSNTHEHTHAHVNRSELSRESRSDDDSRLAPFAFHSVAASCCSVHGAVFFHDTTSTCTLVLRQGVQRYAQCTVY